MPMVVKNNISSLTYQKLDKLSSGRKITRDAVDRNMYQRSAQTEDICLQVREKAYDPTLDALPGVVVFDPYTRTIWVHGNQYPNVSEQAFSKIRDRDTDVADEMVTYTKNNVIRDAATITLKELQGNAFAEFKNVPKDEDLEEVTTIADVSAFKGDIDVNVGDGVKWNVQNGTDIKKTTTSFINSLFHTSNNNNNNRNVRSRSISSTSDGLGYIECYDDAIVAKALLSAAGIDEEDLNAPIDFTLTYNSVNENWDLFYNGSEVEDFTHKLGNIGYNWINHTPPTDEGFVITVVPASTETTLTLEAYSIADDTRLQQYDITLNLAAFSDYMKGSFINGELSKLEYKPSVGNFEVYSIYTKVGYGDINIVNNTFGENFTSFSDLPVSYYNTAFYDGEKPSKFEWTWWNNVKNQDNSQPLTLLN